MRNGNVLKRMTGSQVSFREENGVPRLLLVLEEVNPKTIVGYDEFPGLANGDQLGGFLGADDFEDLRE